MQAPAAETSHIASRHFYSIFSAILGCVLLDDLVSGQGAMRLWFLICRGYATHIQTAPSFGAQLDTVGFLYTQGSSLIRHTRTVCVSSFGLDAIILFNISGWTHQKHIETRCLKRYKKPCALLSFFVPRSCSLRCTPRNSSQREERRIFKGHEMHEKRDILLTLQESSQFVRCK